MTTNYEEPNSARYSGMYQWAPQTDQPILIVNPMHIINLSSHTKSKLVRFFEIFKSFTEKWFSHILLLLFLVLYCCLGAWMFLMLEGANETAAKVGYSLHFILLMICEQEKI
ncbi:TWiK family of potassium channels protein 18-like protein [Leptotrombidium deliense]|uniref:TWiK family of potassium channels protein 18-like protein n=1 Tax=Leptotrombidium deliense TaxID=299467 RepID=A0A443SG10_9ACAR|nr:TWiK family of potassium channels protein 18-like protein [Leptotrombidium deliense]